MEPLGLPDQLFSERQRRLSFHTQCTAEDRAGSYAGGEVRSATLRTIKNMNLVHVKPKPKLYEDS